MSDRDALIAAILANPDEDTPRLALADWLDEHGDPARAEFIRVQCELARQFEAEADLPDSFGKNLSHGGRWGMRWRPHDTEERLTLLRREEELLTAHADEWRKGLPQYADNVHTNTFVQFRRGFVGAVMAALGPFMKSPAALWKHHPVESLMLANCDGAARLKIPACRALAAVRHLRLTGGPTPEAVAPLADCPHLSGVRWLDFNGCDVDEAVAQELARSPHLKPVALEVSCGGRRDTGLAALLNGPFASRLRRLQARHTSTWGAHVVADASLAELRLLDLRAAFYGDAGVAALGQSKHLTQLVSLDLSNTAITNKALEALAGWPGLSGVRALNLGDNRQITARGLIPMLKSPHFRPHYLGLGGTAVGDEGAKALAAWPGLADLIVLDLFTTELGEAGLAALADSPHWRDLRYLTVLGPVLGSGPEARRLRERLGPNRTDLWG
jgi:uncharacterized protein (TIGR02996 family)